MYIFDPPYDVKIKKSTFTEFSKNKIIDGQMIFVLEDD